MERFKFLHFKMFLCISVHSGNTCEWNSWAKTFWGAIMCRDALWSTYASLYSHLPWNRIQNSQTIINSSQTETRNLEPTVIPISLIICDANFMFIGCLVLCACYLPVILIPIYLKLEKLYLIFLMVLDLYLLRCKSSLHSAFIHPCTLAHCKHFSILSLDF